jgi:hypothetical protein
MTTWTLTAQKELENHLDELRPSLVDCGADPDEVVEDLRRHVAEEATAARLRLVTEADVRRLLAQVSPPQPLNEVMRERSRRGTPATTGSKSSDHAWITTALLWLGGVLLPSGTILFEALTRTCAEEFFDPLPSWWHVLMVGGVPLANLLALLRPPVPGGWPWRWAMNGVAAGVSAAYAVMFAPLLPLALVGLVLGVGILPFAPVVALAASVGIRKRLAKRAGPGRDSRCWWLSAMAAVGVLLLLAVPLWTTRYAARVAAHEDSERAEAAVRWLRQWGDPDVLLRDCYGYRATLWHASFPGH